MIENLPGDTREETLAGTLLPADGSLQVHIVRDGDPDSPVALVDAPLSREGALLYATRISGRIHRGKPLTVWVPLRG